jgi:transposase
MIRELFEPWRLAHPSMQDLIARAKQLDNRIWFLPEIGKTFREIEKELHVSLSGIVAVIRTRSHGRKLFHVRGAPRKVTPDIVDWIVSFSMSDGALPSARIAEIIQIEG